MTKRIEWWDWPPEPNGAYRRYAPHVIDMHISASHPFQPRRSLRARIWHAYANAMIGLAKLIVGVVAGLILGARIWSAYANAMWFLAKLIIAVIVTGFTLAAFGLMVILLRL